MVEQRDRGSRSYQISQELAMTATQSFLSNSKYGYDFVVATTQGSLNSTMKEYLSTADEPEVVICYIADATGAPTQIDYEQLKRNAQGSDPFAVPNNADPATNQDLKNLFAARFMVGFKASIGLPPGYAPTAIPDIITLSADASSVSYNLMCSEFIVVQYTPASGYSPASWMNVSQQPGKAWLFNSKVDLRLARYDDAYSKLPKAVQAAIKNLGNAAFSVQQLLFDLDNAALESVPQMERVDPGSTPHALLQQHFLGSYFNTVKKRGQPVLGVSVTPSIGPPSTLTMTDLNFEVSPLRGANGQPIVNPTPAQQDAFTLNYLCAANGKSLPGPSEFTWNWMEMADEANFDGVIAINRDSLRSYFQHSLENVPRQNCYQPSVRVTAEGLSAKYEWTMHPGGAPQVTTPATGPTVLSYSYSATANDVAGLNGDIGQLRLSPSFAMDVSFAGNQIVITQHLLIYTRIQSLQTADAGNVVDKTIVDTYTVTANAYGQLVATLHSSESDKSQTPSVNGFLNFFTGVNNLINDVAGWARSATSTGLKDIPVSVVQSFVFPGGKTFVFKDASFSANQDLVGHITYADPT
jgi:hypothetical protein